jgi:hypothetical protein
MSMIDADARARRLRRCGSVIAPRPASSSRRNAVDKALVISHVARLVGNGLATWRDCRGGTLEVTLATGETYRLGKTTVMRIF